MLLLQLSTSTHLLHSLHVYINGTVNHAQFLQSHFHWWHHMVNICIVWPKPFWHLLCTHTTIWWYWYWSKFFFLKYSLLSILLVCKSAAFNAFPKSKIKGDMFALFSAHSTLNSNSELSSYLYYVVGWEEMMS